MEEKYKIRLNKAIAGTGKKRKEIADELGMPHSTFYNICAGQPMPGPRADIAKYLNLTVKHLFGGYK